MRNSVRPPLPCVPPYPNMTTLRASSGTTSSVPIFWLIPAIRRKERNGPGITTTARLLLPARSPEGGLVVAPRTEAVKQQLNRDTHKKAWNRIADFMIGAPLRTFDHSIGLGRPWDGV